MYYYFNLDNFPEIHQSYTVSRNTSWQIVDNNNILVFIIEGKCNFHLNGKTYALEQGDTFFIPANVSYTRKPVDGALCTMHYIHFSSKDKIIAEDPVVLREGISKTQMSMNTDSIFDRKLQYPKVIYLKNKIKGTNYNKTKELVNGVNMFSVNRDITSGLESEINFLTFLILLSKNTIKTLLNDTSIKNSVSFPKPLKEALSYVAENSCRQITLDELAEHCHISKHQLIRYFKKSLGITPINYINDYKIARAKEMLFHHSPLSIKEISDELGFSSQYYFTNVFTKATGETPSKYRSRTTNYKPH